LLAKLQQVEEMAWSFTGVHRGFCGGLSCSSSTLSTCERQNAETNSINRTAMTRIEIIFLTKVANL